MSPENEKLRSKKRAVKKIKISSRGGNRKRKLETEGHCGLIWLDVNDGAVEGEVKCRIFRIWQTGAKLGS